MITCVYLPIYGYVNFPYYDEQAYVIQNGIANFFLFIICDLVFAI